MQYKYKGITKEGKRVKGVIVAGSFSEAKQILKNKNIIYESLEETTGGISLLPNIKKRPIKGSLMSAFAKELSSYLSSGMPLVTALKLMHNQHKNEKNTPHL